MNGSSEITENQETPENESDKEAEEIEPKFKYIRLACDLKDILKNASVSCIAAHSKFLLLGTNWGDTHILDHEGNTTCEQNFPKHIVSVNQISVDSKGEYIGSCSDDGKIHINCLYSEENNVKFNLDRKIRCIELDPMHWKSGAGRKFIVGDNQLTMYEKTFLKGLKSTVLSDSEGFVNAVKWNGQFVAWASGIGVRVYDLNEKCSLGLIKWEEPKSGKLSDFRCNLRWSNSTTLLIGWVETIRICVIRKRNLVEVSTRNLPAYIVDPISTFQTDFYVCGLAPLEINQLVVLGIPKDKDKNEKSLRPVLCVIQYKCNDYAEICTDSLTLRGYENYQWNDYHLECLIEENKYFVVSPKDIVSASLYETDDRVQWLIEHNKYDQAIEVITAHGGKYTIMQVARLYVDHLLSFGQYDEAAKLCLRAFGNDKDLWEEEVYKFVKVKQLRSVSPYLPRTNDCKLNPHVYEMVMYEYLKLDKAGFLNLIKEWQPNLYDTTAVINAVHDHYDKKYKHILLEALAILYSHEKEYEKSIAMYLKLQHKDVFTLIKKHDLYNAIHNMIVDLIKLDSEKAISMLLEKNKLAPEIVVKQLENHQEYLYMFLDAYERVNGSGKFHKQLLNLYPKYDRNKLLPFLKSSRNYSIQDAYDICKRESFYPEMVYLLDQMGNTKEALTIIMHKMKNIQMAIEFCREHDDLDLWNKMINESVDSPTVLTKLLDGIAGFINPELLIDKIKVGQEIPGLKNALVKMLSGFSLQVSIHDGCNQILATDYFNLHEKLVYQQNKALFVNNESCCGLCQRDVIVKDPKSDIIVFNCKHLFHENCLPENFNLDYCSICKSKNQ